MQDTQKHTVGPLDREVPLCLWTPVWPFPSHIPKSIPWNRMGDLPVSLHVNITRQGFEVWTCVHLQHGNTVIDVIFQCVHYCVRHHVSVYRALASPTDITVLLRGLLVHHVHSMLCLLAAIDETTTELQQQKLANISMNVCAPFIRDWRYILLLQPKIAFLVHV